MHYQYTQIQLVMVQPIVFSVLDYGFLILTQAAAARKAPSTLNILKQTEEKNKWNKFFIEVAYRNLK